MLSIENPPESSSSHKKAQSSPNTVDEKCSDNYLHDSQKHSFSIRDYVFSSRSKGIKSSWPFQQQTLQLCLKHGIKEILPPFEPPDLIRSQLFAQEVEQILPQADCSSDKEPVNLNYDSGLTQSRDKVKPSLDAELITCETEIHSTVTSRDLSDKQFSQISELDEKQKKKKCKLIVKLSTISEKSRAEDISSVSTVSDTMASNVCPVCKTFSSSSNTTLNAHIDQCLSEESNAKGIIVATEPKLKVKPKKKRLMVDIYTTAPVCTLEDLDRRNGTNWAVELAMLATSRVPQPNLVAQMNETSVVRKEVDNEAKKAKVSTEDEKEIRDGGDEGEVYVDSNGIKVRILSKFKDVSPVVSKHAKNMKIGGSSLIGQKKQFFAQHVKMKHIELEQQRKKSPVLKLSQRQMQEELHTEFQSDDGSEKEESESWFAADPDTRLKACSSLTKWVCSKRSDLSKKYKNKDIQMPSDNTLTKTRSPLIENNEANSHNVPVLRSHVLKLSKLPGDLNSSPKTKQMDVICSTKINIGNKVSSKWRSECSSSSSGLLLKLSRSTGKVISSPRSKRKEIRREITKQPSKFSKSMEEQRGIKMDKGDISRELSLSPKTNKGDEKEKHVTYAGIRKHRSQKGGGELVIPDTEGSHYVSRNLDTFRSVSRSVEDVEGEKEPLLVSHDIESEAMEVAVSHHGSDENQISEKIQFCESEEEYCLIQGDEFHMGPLSGQASFTSSHSNGESEIPHENSSVTSTGPMQSQDQNLATYMVTSGSPISTPNDPVPSNRPTTDSPRDPCSNISTSTKMASIPCTEETIIEGTPKGPEEFMKDHPCCCSRRAIPSLEIPFDSTTTSTVPSNSSFKYPSFINFTSPSPSPRTQTLLRLMGKNLMVDKEQSLQLPSSNFHSPMNEMYTSPLGFTPTVSVRPQLYHHYHQFSGQVKSVHDNHVLARSLSESLYSGSFTQQIHGEIPISRSSSMNQEVIMINDSPEREVEASNIGLQRSFSCFPLPSGYLTRDNSSSTPPSCPRTNTMPMKGGTASEASTHIGPHLYYSQTFW